MKYILVLGYGWSGSSAVIDLLSKMYKDVLPEIAKNIAEPMSKIGDIKIYGNTGQEASGISGNVPLMMKKTMDLMTDATGVDMAERLKTNTLAAKTDRNIKIDSKEGDGDSQEPAVVVK